MPTNPGTTDLLCWFPLNESSGNATDAHAAITLTNRNTVTYASGKQSNAASFTIGSSNDLYTNAFPSQTGSTTARTLVAWFNRSSSAHKLNVSFGTTGGNRFGLQLYDTGLIYHVVEVSGPIYPSYSDSNTGWHFYALVYDGGLIEANRIRGWRDATEQSMPAFGGEPTSYTKNATFTIGSMSGVYSTGLIDEVAVWDRALTQDEIDWLYNSGSGRTYADLSGGGGDTRARLLGGDLFLTPLTGRMLVQ